jgi:hypothetical protein
MQYSPEGKNVHTLPLGEYGGQHKRSLLLSAARTRAAELSIYRGRITHHEHGAGTGGPPEGGRAARAGRKAWLVGPAGSPPG